MSLPQQAYSWLGRSGAVGLALFRRRALAAFLAVPFNREKDGANIEEFSLLGSVLVNIFIVEISVPFCHYNKIFSYGPKFTGSHPLI